MSQHHSFVPSPLLCGPKPAEGEIHIKAPRTSSEGRPFSKGEYPHG